MRTAMFCIMLCCTSILQGQQSTNISGIVKDGKTLLPISNAFIRIEGVLEKFNTTNNGQFSIVLELSGTYVVQVGATDFVPKQFEILLDGSLIDLGEIFLEKDIVLEKTVNLIALTDNDLSDDEGLISGNMGMLQSTRDVFLTRAAFDFGQAFFKVRGYDSRNGTVLINGIPMNKLWDGRPQWNNWGGLNDVTRNQTFTNTLEINRYTFGGILGNTNIDTRPSKLRSGLRISSSLSNRTYGGRVMTTYNSGWLEGRWAYSLSASRRWAKTGYVEGTLYDAYSWFGAVEYQISDNQSLSMGAIAASNRRGRSPALTVEVAESMGNRYNPYWGTQNGKIRNSRERKINEPIVMLNHFLESAKLNWTSGILLQNGVMSKGRLGYYDAPNPDPTYYKYLPSNHINSSFGADFANAKLASEALIAHPQLNWEQIYEINKNTSDGKAAYVLYDDVIKERRMVVSSSMEVQVWEQLKLGLGANIEKSNSTNYGEITDLLGAEFHEDQDPFSLTQNDFLGTNTKLEGEKIGYNYVLQSEKMDGFIQTEFSGKVWSGFVAASYSKLKTFRNGLFQNERYLDNSLGKSGTITHGGLRFKSGMTIFLSGRHWFTANASQVNRPPILQNVFINLRESNLVVPESKNELVSALDINYFIRLPDLTGRLSAFYTRFQDATDINFFFVDSGLGSDFVQEVVTGLDMLHKGLELGLEYQASNEVKLSLAANLGSYVFASDPEVELYFDTSGPEEDLINSDGNVDLGVAKIKGLRLAQGPQTAIALGIEYRSPKYWWLGTTANFLDHNYANLSIVKRTQSFLLDPDTGEPHPDATESNLGQILNQGKLDEIYLLNLIGGKSWLINRKYVSLFVSVNNVFDSIFRTGGYEQSRNGNYKQMNQDHLSGTPSFGPKYWYGYGRTYFLNLAINF